MAVGADWLAFVEDSGAFAASSDDLPWLGYVHANCVYPMRERSPWFRRPSLNLPGE